jgi:hypothetical protein
MIGFLNIFKIDAGVCKFALNTAAEIGLLVLEGCLQWAHQYSELAGKQSKEATLFCI